MISLKTIARPLRTWALMAACLIGMASDAWPAGPIPPNGCASPAGTAILCPAPGAAPIPTAGQGERLQRQKREGAAAGHSGDAVSALGACAGCHVETPVLPPGHAATPGMPLAHCRTCHVPQSPMSLAGVLPLDHTHALAGQGCAACHGDDAPFEEPETERCLTCHGPLDALAAATADVPDANPHASPHGAPFAECALCHMQHEPSQNFCATCHDFEFTLP